MDATNARWDKLNGSLGDRQQGLDDANKKLGELDEKLKPISKLVEEAQNLVKDPVPVGADVEKGKEAKVDANVSSHKQALIYFPLISAFE